MAEAAEKVIQDLAATFGMWPDSVEQSEERMVQSLASVRSFLADFGSQPGFQDDFVDALKWMSAAAQGAEASGVSATAALKNMIRDQIGAKQSLLNIIGGKTVSPAELASGYVELGKALEKALDPIVVLLTKAHDWQKSGAGLIQMAALLEKVLAQMVGVAPEIPVIGKLISAMMTGISTGVKEIPNVIVSANQGISNAVVEGIGKADIGGKAADALAKAAESAGGSGAGDKKQSWFVGGARIFSTAFGRLEESYPKLGGMLTQAGASIRNAASGLFLSLMPLTLIANITRNILEPIVSMANDLLDILADPFIALSVTLSTVLFPVFRILSAILMPVVTLLSAIIHPFVRLITDVLDPVASVLEMISNVADTALSGLISALSWLMDVLPPLRWAVEALVLLFAVHLIPVIWKMVTAKLAAVKAMWLEHAATMENVWFRRGESLSALKKGTLSAVASTKASLEWAWTNKAKLIPTLVSAAKAAWTWSKAFLSSIIPTLKKTAIAAWASVKPFLLGLLPALWKTVVAAWNTAVAFLVGVAPGLVAAAIAAWAFLAPILAIIWPFVLLGIVIAGIVIGILWLVSNWDKLWGRVMYFFSGQWLPWYIKKFLGIKSDDEPAVEAAASGITDMSNKGLREGLFEESAKASIDLSSIMAEQMPALSEGQKVALAPKVEGPDIGGTAAGALALAESVQVPPTEAERNQLEAAKRQEGQLAEVNKSVRDLYAFMEDSALNQDNLLGIDGFLLQYSKGYS